MLQEHVRAEHNHNMWMGPALGLSTKMWWMSSEHVVRTFYNFKKRMLLTVITDSVVRLSSDFALLRGGRVEAKSKSSAASRLCP